MKKLLMLVLLCVPGLLHAQEHYEPGSYWEVTAVDTKPAMFDAYIEDLDGLWRKQMDALIADGKVKSYRMFANVDARNGEPDLYLYEMIQLSDDGEARARVWQWFKSDRLLQRGRQEGVVDGVDRAAGPGQRGHLLDVDDPEQRVRRRFRQYQPRLPGAGGGKRLVVTLVDEQHLEMPLAAERLVKPVGAAVAVMRDDHQVTRLQQLHQHVKRCHTRCRNHRAGTAFERGQRLTERIPRRVAGPRVVILALLTETRECVVRGQVQRRYDGTVLGIGLDGRAHGARGPGCV